MKRRLCFLALTASLALEVLLEIGAREGWAPTAGSSERVASLRLALLLSALGLAGFLWFRSDRAQKGQKRIEALLEDADRAEAQVRLGTWSLDPPFRQTRWSRGIRRLLDLPPEAPAGEETLCTRMAPQDVATLRKHEETLALRGGSFHFEHPIHLPDGSDRVVRAIGEALEDPTGRVTRLFGTLQDVTELRALGSELESSRQRLQFALEGAQDGLWDWDLVTGETYFSPRYYTMLGYEPGSFPAPAKPGRPCSTRRTGRRSSGPSPNAWSRGNPSTASPSGPATRTAPGGGSWAGGWWWDGTRRETPCAWWGPTRTSRN